MPEYDPAKNDSFWECHCSPPRRFHVATPWCYDCNVDRTEELPEPLKVAARNRAAQGEHDPRQAAQQPLPPVGGVGLLLGTPQPGGQVPFFPLQYVAIQQQPPAWGIGGSLQAPAMAVTPAPHGLQDRNPHVPMFHQLAGAGAQPRFAGGEGAASFAPGHPDWPGAET